MTMTMTHHLVGFLQKWPSKPLDLGVFPTSSHLFGLRKLAQVMPGKLKEGLEKIEEKIQAKENCAVLACGGDARLP